jgi:hypothetical protein
VRRRISIVGAALTAGLLAVGVAIAPAASTKPAKPKPVTVTCTTAVSTATPPGQSALVPPVMQGTDYGTVKCSGKQFGHGVHTDTFTVPDSGDTVGTYTQYFDAGSIHGKFDLTPGEASPPTTDTILASTYTGTETVAGGTGVYVGIKGTGTSTCASPDDIHTTCTIKLKLKLPASLG